MTMSDDIWMQEALKEARTSFQHGEVPVGSVLVREGQIIGRGRNQREEKQDPLSHAEMETLRQASKVLRNWRVGGVLYVTLEPCPMCVGAVLQARVEEVVFACADPKGGALGGIVNLAEGYTWNHRLKVRSGVLEEEARRLLREFFEKLRADKIANL
jgi:tRNA(adenine34) deaminase